MKEKYDSYDIISGLIADDRMSHVFQLFMSGGITLTGLIECLKLVRYGYQTVFRTQVACKRVSLLRYRLVSDAERCNAIGERQRLKAMLNSRISKIQKETFGDDVVYNILREYE